MLAKSPSYRHQAARRWLAVVGGFAALALAAGLFGALTGPSHGPPRAPSTGPFSYIPVE